MQLIEKINFRVRPILKTAGIAILVLAAIYIVFQFLGALFNLLPFGSQSRDNYGYSSNDSYEKMAAPLTSSYGGFGLGDPLSSRNIQTGKSSNYIKSEALTDNQAENYEMVEYNATIETRQLAETCAAVSGLKARPDVIFENAREYRSNCNYTFKVQKDKTEEILAFLKQMNPKELSGNTYTIQGQINDYTGQIDILKKKLESIDETLTKAVEAYEQVAQQATSARDVASLAKVIDSKISTIERLAQERITINSQLDQLERGKTAQVDRLDYAYFSVTVADGSFIDWRNIKDSWNYAVKETARRINDAVLNISVNLIAFLFGILQYVVYGLVLLFVAKYSWKTVKNVWQR